MENKQTEHIPEAGEKLTALEWFAEQIVDLSTQLMDKQITQLDFANGLIEKEEIAKQMEKEQIINAFGEKRQFMGFGDNDTFGITEKTGQEYYNETYGKRN